ncbi:hypothetical protein MRX96_023159 [Rhipicephalus microplus]
MVPAEKALTVTTNVPNMPGLDSVQRRFQENTRRYQLQPAKIVRARKEDCGIPKPPAFPRRVAEQYYGSLSDNGSITSDSLTHSSSCCDRTDQPRAFGTSKETTTSRVNMSAGHDRRTGLEVQPSRPIENTVRRALLSVWRVRRQSRASSYLPGSETRCRRSHDEGTIMASVHS